MAPVAGCYHCCTLLDPKEITEYTDRDTTCICPKCKVDAVVAGLVPADLTVDKLERANAYWFSTRGRSSRPSS